MVSLNKTLPGPKCLELNLILGTRQIIMHENNMNGLYIESMLIQCCSNVVCLLRPLCVFQHIHLPCFTLFRYFDAYTLVSNMYMKMKSDIPIFFFVQNNSLVILCTLFLCHRYNPLCVNSETKMTTLAFQYFYDKIK